MSRRLSAILGIPEAALLPSLGAGQGDSASGERLSSATASATHHRRTSSMTSFASMMSSLSLSRTLTNEKDREKDKDRDKDKDKEQRGRTLNVPKHLKSRSASTSQPQQLAERDPSRSRARSQSPFSFRKFRTKEREASPTPEAVPLSSSDLATADNTPGFRTRTSFNPDDPDSGTEDEGGFGDDATSLTLGDTDDQRSDSDVSLFDPLTEANTERNSVSEPIVLNPGEEDMHEHDPLGEGVNVVVPPEPYFPSTLLTGPRKRNPKRKKSVKYETLPLDTSRPIFERDRCTIIMTQGDPIASLTSAGRKRRRYVVASDLSEESRYAVEWGIGTVLRDGDEMLIVIVMEDENKVDPQIPSQADRAQKLRSQQERQAMAYILVRQATQLLQRTRLNVRVSCQAWHAKNARHMLLDIVDYFEPMMLIVGSRGLGQLQGILLGSTSHYLIQKCSVPVMVARRRLRRPPKRAAHLDVKRRHVKLSEAAIDRVADRVDQDVKDLREMVEEDDKRRKEGGSREPGPSGADVDAYGSFEEDSDNEEPLSQKQ